MNMTDKEVIEVLKTRPDLVKMLHRAAELDDVSIHAVVIYAEGLAAGDKEAAQKAARYLIDHGRPKAAQKILEGIE